MSRYRIPGGQGLYECFVGYDPPLKTLFGQKFFTEEYFDRLVTEGKLTEDNDELLFGCGYLYGEVTTFDQLVEKCQGHFGIPEVFREVLTNEYETGKTIPDSPLTKQLKEMGILE